MVICSDGNHKKEYDDQKVGNNFPPEVNWICSVCGAEGVDPKPENMLNKYESTKFDKMNGAFDTEVKTNG